MPLSNGSSDTPDVSAQTLWHFALASYGLPGAEQACLRLQAAGADVCLLLSAAWLGQRAVMFTPERAAALEALAAPWRHAVVEPLRTLRQQWRTAAYNDPSLSGLREGVKGLEQEAERCLLERLEALSTPWTADGSDDLWRWLHGVAGPAAEQDHQALQTLRAVILGQT